MASPRLHETDGESHVPPSRGPREVVCFHASAQAVLRAADTTRLRSIQEGNNLLSQRATPQSYLPRYIVLPPENK